MPKKEELNSFIGKKYNKLTIISDNGIRNSSRYVIAMCECGNTNEFRLRALKTGNTKSCGCIIKGDPDKLISKRYNHFIIISFLGYINGKSNVLVECDCGKQKSIFLNDLKTGNTKSCGCIKEVKNGLSNHPIHRIWIKMILRCTDPTEKSYKYYGAKGVKVCDEWLTDFMCFYNWAKERWAFGLQLDKDLLAPKKIGLLYSPEYCCFLTPKQNCRNRSNNNIIEYNNEKHCITEWAEILSIPYTTLKARLKRGWSVEKSFTEPLKN